MAIPKFFKSNGSQVALADVGIDQSTGASDGHKVIVTDLSTGKMHKSFKPGNNGFDYVGDWLNKPASLTNAYTDRIFVTDVGGASGSEWYWDGSRYRAVGGSVTLATRNASNSATVNTTTETKLISYAIPAGIIQSGDTIKIEAKIVRTSALTEAISINQFYQLHNTDSFQASPASQQNASLVSGSVSSYEFYEYRCVNNTTIKQLSAVTGTGYGTGGATNQPDRTVSDLSTNIIYAGVYAKYASTPTGAANCDFFRVILNTEN